ncbi:type I restriction-modification protein subunit S [Zoogloea oryzae]|uniref:Type I restriction-modification protein subunit S n=1 Tax=Zoogloea oryzae TaxID=310767 RepID=A0ABQ6FD74_9RHOO|nr:restriction endonuclease subunit S [Zoogloea oryzae]GLT23542.1 type I restriction-modification protein subunit S [Zoogloea oryzae]
MSLPRYPEYKDSGVEWLGEVPAHWETWKLRHAFGAIGSGTTPPSDERHWYDEGTIPWITTGELREAVVCETTKSVTPAALQKFSTLKVHPKGALVIAMYGATIGRLGFLGVDAATNQACCVLSVPRSLDVRFVFYWLHGFKQRIIDLYATGGGQPNISQETISSLRIPAPNIPEQTAIATFLDRETGKIDALIAEQETLLRLLAEKRQATISHAVTKGLNPNAPMKDSGVAWLGEVPEHWVLTPLGRISVARCDGPFGSGIKSEHYTDEGALVVRLQNIRAGLFNMGEPVFLDESYFQKELRGHEVKEGDLLVAGLGDDNNLLGRACVAPDGLGVALVKADCFRFRLDTERAIPEFVAWQLSTGAAHDAGAMATGTTRSRIPLSIMSSRKLALPPSEEQAAITAFIARETAKLDALKTESERAIALLKERRTALISAAVTGKIDVRHEAA